MESLVITADLRADWAEAVGGVSSLVKAAPKLPDDCRRGLSEQIHELAVQVIGISKQLRDWLYTFLRSSDSEQTPDRLNEVLVLASLVGTRLERLISAPSEQLSSALMAMADIKAITDLADEFDEIAETVALGLSDSFQTDIKNAKQAIG